MRQSVPNATNLWVSGFTLLCHNVHRDKIIFQGSILIEPFNSENRRVDYEAVYRGSLQGYEIKGGGARMSNGHITTDKVTFPFVMDSTTNDGIKSIISTELDDYIKRMHLPEPEIADQKPLDGQVVKVDEVTKPGGNPEQQDEVRPNPYKDLKPRMLDVLLLLAGGKRVSDISTAIGVSAPAIYQTLTTIRLILNLMNMEELRNFIQNFPPSKNAMESPKNSLPPAQTPALTPLSGSVIIPQDFLLALSGFGVTGRSLSESLTIECLMSLKEGRCAEVRLVIKPKK